VVDTELLQCNGTAEQYAAMLRAERLEGAKRVSIAADKGYDTKDFVREMRGMNATPHVSQNQKRAGGSATDGRTTRHAAIRSANGGGSGLGSIRMGEDDADVAPAWRGRRSVGAVFRGNRGYLSRSDGRATITQTFVFIDSHIGHVTTIHG
jgi:hypothetical protein